MQNFGTLANITHHEMVRLRTRGENLAVISQGLSPGVPVVQRNHGFINFQPRAPVPTQHREDNPRLQVTLRIRLEKKISLVKGAIYPSNLDNKTAKHLCFFFYIICSLIAVFSACTVSPSVKLWVKCNGYAKQKVAHFLAAKVENNAFIKQITKFCGSVNISNTSNCPSFFLIIMLVAGQPVCFWESRYGAYVWYNSAVPSFLFFFWVPREKSFKKHRLFSFN